MARGRGGGPETEVAGRPPLPRHKSLPAVEKKEAEGDGTAERRLERRRG